MFRFFLHKSIFDGSKTLEPGYHVLDAAAAKRVFLLNCGSMVDDEDNDLVISAPECVRRLGINVEEIVFRCDDTVLKRLRIKDNVDRCRASTGETKQQLKQDIERDLKAQMEK